MLIMASSRLFAQKTPTSPDLTSPQLTDVKKSPCWTEQQRDKVTNANENVVQGLLIGKVNPKYPVAARRAHIEGVVVMCASVSKEGKIENLKAVAGPAELIPSSLKAVKKWRYKPYMVNGKPVEVETEVRVNYAISH